MRSSQGLCKDRDSRNPLEEMVKSLRCFQGMYLGMEQGQAAHGPSSLLGPGCGAPLGPMLRKHVVTGAHCLHFKPIIHLRSNMRRQEICYN